MKIANITCVYPPYGGGIGSAAKEFADLATAAGHEVVTFMPDYGNSHHPRRTTPSPSLERRGDLLQEEGRRESGGSEDGNAVKLKTFLKYGNAAFLPQFFWRLKDFNIIYLNYPFFGTQEVLWLALKIFYPKKKFIIRYHMDFVGRGIFFMIFSLPLKIIFKSFFRRADLIITASLDYVRHGDLAKIYQKHSAFAKASADKPEKFVEIPYSVDTEKFKPADPTSPAPSWSPSSAQGGHCRAGGENSSLKRGGVFNILFVGGLDRAHYFKGVDILLKALALIDESPLKITAEAGQEGGVRLGRTACPATCPSKHQRSGKLRLAERSWGRVYNWHLSIIGRGELKSKYEKIAKDLGIADKVSFLDKVGADELPAYYKKSDCLILPSINKCEAFGIVLIEAMACGLPVIASDLPGVRGVFEEGRSGLKIIPNNTDDLAKKIKYLMDNPEVCNKMGAEARKSAVEKYSRDKIKNKLISLLVD